MTREPLRDSCGPHRDFRTLWLSDVASQFGTAVHFVAIPLIAATVLSAGPVEMGLLTAAGTAANLVLGLPAGAWMDRIRRLPVMRWAEAGQLLLLASVPIAWWAGALAFPHLLAVALLCGGMFTFFEIASQSHLPTIVGRADLSEANRKLHTTRQVMHFSGRPLSGVLAQFLGATNALVASVLGFGASLALLGRMRPEHPMVDSRGSRGRLGTEVAEGLRFLFAHWLLRPTTLFSMSHYFFLNVYVAVNVLFLVRDLHLAEGTVGLLLSVTGAGGILGGLTTRFWSNAFGAVRAMIVVTVVTTPFRLLVPLAESGWGIALFVVGVLVGGYGTVVFAVIQVSLRQSVCPERLLGRVNASTRFLTFGAIPLGALTGGLLGAVIGIRATILVAAVGMTASCCWLFVAPLRHLREAPEELLAAETGLRSIVQPPKPDHHGEADGAASR
ncbi:MFS transporter [Actinoalloteichus hymeniacidonis]|uniref:Arabinose efflux permease family protein n=1 Tax=Actinoalloteichus hymeniacidonis TaxID=340345 RepID=A0AAC9HNR7_9PSEU|nr:MFS transporter [Actinoalloteichus hymeniacidonis]AOS62528.1 arabinose efflux permease family protein [Actinoalloteichus hymeniacidonis]MBB5909441.1 MFS family permease [Actinoalloteichus hymeniacidonis]